MEGVQQLWANGYHPRDHIERTPELREALGIIASGLFSHGDKTLFAPFLDSIWNHDPYLVCADFADYQLKQADAGLHYADAGQWARMSILNVARMGYFSSDRAIAEYARDIWRIGMRES